MQLSFLSFLTLQTCWMLAPMMDLEDPKHYLPVANGIYSSLVLLLKTFLQHLDPDADAKQAKKDREFYEALTSCRGVWKDQDSYYAQESDNTESERESERERERERCDHDEANCFWVGN